MAFKMIPFLALLGCCALATLYEFKADFVSTGDPLIPNSVVKGTIVQIFDDTADIKNNQGKSHITYTDPATLHEILIVSTSLRYRFCSDDSCETETTSDLVQPFHYQAYPTVVQNGDLIMRARTTTASNQINTIYFNSAGVPVKAIFHNGKVWTLSNVKTTLTAAEKDFDAPTSCPQPVCNAVMDVAIVMDMSSSIDDEEGEVTCRYYDTDCDECVKETSCAKSITTYTCKPGKTCQITTNSDGSQTCTSSRSSYCVKGSTCTQYGETRYKVCKDPSEWGMLKDFVVQTLKMFNLDQHGTHAGVVAFNNKVTVVHPMSYDKKSLVSTVAGLARTGSGTCQGIGIKSAFEDLFANLPEERKKINAPKVVITITDGAEYCNGGLQAADAMNTYGSRATFISLGIGTNSLNDVLKKIASRSDLSMLVSKFADLEDKLSALVSLTCQQIEPINLCGAACNGFCGCNRQCICPICDVPDPCHNGQCKTGNEGCIIAEKSCTSKCHTQECVVQGDQGVCVDVDSLEPENYKNDHCVTTSCTEESGWVPTPVECPHKTCQTTIKNSDKEGCCEYKPLCEEKSCHDVTCADDKCNYQSKNIKDEMQCQFQTCTAGADGEDVVTVATAYPCAPKKCQIATCTPGKGCQYTDKCVSDDPCLKAICDDNEECSFTRVCNWCDLHTQSTSYSNAESCDDGGHECYVYGCDRTIDSSYDVDANGESIDFCTKDFIGIDACAAKICIEDKIPKDVELKPCHKWVCNADPAIASEPASAGDVTTPVLGWYQEYIEGCDACDAYPCSVENGDAPLGVCQEYKCTVVYEDSYEIGDRECTILDKATEGVCKGTNPCLIYGCTDDKCTQQKRVVSDDVTNSALFDEKYDPCFNYVCQADGSGYKWVKDGDRKANCNWCTQKKEGSAVTNGEDCLDEPVDPCFKKVCVADDTFVGQCNTVFIGEEECEALLCTAEEQAKLGPLGDCMEWVCRYQESSATGWEQVYKKGCDACQAHPCPANGTPVEGSVCNQYTGVCTVESTTDFSANGRTCEVIPMVEGKCAGSDPCVIYGCADNMCTATPRVFADAPLDNVDGGFVDPCYDYVCAADDQKTDGFIWKKTTIKSAGCNGCTYNNNAAKCPVSKECSKPVCTPLNQPVDGKLYTCSEQDMTIEECAAVVCPYNEKPTYENPCLEAVCDAVTQQGWVSKFVDGCNLCDFIEYNGELSKCQRVECAMRENGDYEQERKYTADDLEWTVIEATAEGERCYSTNPCKVGSCNTAGACVFTDVAYTGEGYDDECLTFTCTAVNNEAKWTSERHCTWCDVDPENAKSCNKGVPCYVYSCEAESTSGSVADNCKESFIGTEECAAKICTQDKIPKGVELKPCHEWVCNADPAIAGQPSSASDVTTPVLGWYQKYIEGCDACDAYPCSVENGDADVGICEVYKCTVTNANGYTLADRECSVVGKFCTGDNACMIYSCADDICTSTPRVFDAAKDSTAVELDGQYDQCFNYVCQIDDSSDSGYKWVKNGDRKANCDFCTITGCGAHAHPCKRYVCEPEDTFNGDCTEEEQYIFGAACDALVCENGCQTDDPCRIARCDTENTMGCVYDWKEGCDACKANPCVPSDKCNDVKCSLTQEGEASAGYNRIGTEAGRQCTESSKTAVGGSCYSEDLCKVGTCNPVDGSCTFPDKQPTAEELASINKCEYLECAEDGTFEKKAKVCNSPDPCLVSTCDTADGLCKTTPRCKHENCYDTQCVVDSAGMATCVKTKRNCFLNHCVVGTCNTQTDACEYTPIELPTENCKVITCDPNADNAEDAIVKEDVHCSGTPCFPGKCNADTGECYTSSLCGDGDYCYEALCSNEECYSVLRPSEISLTKEESGCFRTVCSVEKERWSKVIIPEAFLDSCGDCYQMFYTEYSGSHDNVKCLAGMTVAEFGATMGGVAIAGIVAAVLIGVAVVATTGFYGTKELLRLAGVGADSGMHNNPLYEDDGVSMENPMFDERN